MIYGNPLIFGGSGGGSDTYAFIIVTYPAGSTCTASDGTTTLTAPDTSGSWVCKVPSAGTWTVSCTDGTDTASAAVSITTEGQRESVTLMYALWLYDLGNTFDAVTGGYTKVYDTSGSSGSFILGTDAITVKGGSRDSAASCGCSTVNAVDLTNISTLHIRVRSGKAGYSGYYAYFGVAQAAGYASLTSITRISSTGEHTVDVSGLTGLWYVKVYGVSESGQAVFDKMWGTP